ncbi:MAG: hypothetical protein U9M92_02965 [Patescibacteria group bacterium]|nr:hypothetical protein [Patescibacteria group bacterium]
MNKAIYWLFVPALALAMASTASAQTGNQDIANSITSIPGSGIVSPDSNGNCPSAYQKSGDVCIKPLPTNASSNGGGVVGDGSPGNQSSQSGGSAGHGNSSQPQMLPTVIGSGQFTVAPNSEGNCPEGYKTGANGKTCLKPSISVSESSDVKIVIDSGQISIEDAAKLPPKPSSSSGGSGGGKKATFQTQTRTNAGIQTVVSVGISSGGSGSGGAKQVNVEVVDGGVVITEGDQVVPTEVKVEIADGKIKLGKDKGELKVLPSVASEKAVAVLGEKYDRVELKEVGNKETAYVFEKDVEEKFLGLFKIKVVSKVNVRTESGADDISTLKVKKPWWSFLTF